MKFIQNLISTPGELKLPISPSAFESALQEQTYSAESEDDISGHAIKFDQENYDQNFHGRISGGQFQLRPFRKSGRMQLSSFLISGSYAPATEGTKVSYTLSLNPKATVLLLLAIIGFSVQLVATQIFAMPGPSIFGFYAVAFPILGLGWLFFRFKKMLAPAQQQFEDDLNNINVQTPDTADSLDAIVNSEPRSILPTIVLLGTVFFLVGAGLGLFNYSKAKRTTVFIQGEVIELKGGRKGGYHPVVSYTPEDGITRTYESSYNSNPPQYAVGDKVPMYYDPASPNRVRIDNALEAWFFAANFGLGGLIMLIVAGLGYRNRTRLD
jgi:hypothetical protein